MTSICRKKWQRRGFATGILGNKGPCSGGCDDFTLTVETLGLVNPGIDTDEDGFFGIVATPTNQEYFFRDEEGEIVRMILPWVTIPFRPGNDLNILPSLNIRTDRSCCQDAIQISLVGEDIQDLDEFVPLNFEVPAGESAIMIPFGFSSEAPVGPKIIGVQAIGCGQNKIKDLYFEYINPDAPSCPDEIYAYVSVYNNFGTWYDLYLYSDIAGDYEVEFFINEISTGIATGYTNGEGEQITINASAVWDPSAKHSLNVRFKPYEFGGELSCDDLCGSIQGVGSFSDSFYLYPCAPEPYYGMAAIGEGLLKESLKPKYVEVSASSASQAT